MTNLMELPEDIFEKAAKIYGHSVKSLEEDVDILAEWMRIQPHLPEIMDRTMIRNFVISNKFSIERAKQKLDCYYTLRSKIPDVFDHFNNSQSVIKEALDWDFRFLPLPKLTEDLYRMFMMTFPKGEKSKNLNLNACLACVEMIQEIRAKEDCFVGDVIVVDLRNFSLDFMFMLTPTFLAKCVACYEKIWSMPLKSAHVINSPPYVGHLLNILKSLIKPKLFERIHVHADEKILLQSFPKRIIPLDYGGEEKSLDELQEMWKVKLGENNERFEKWTTMKVEEALRPETLVNDDFLGFHGHFKTLNVD